MRIIAPSRLIPNLPLFDWAERHRAAPLPPRMKAYRTDKWLAVQPVWKVQHD